jgi:hypothetical protein
MTRVALSASAAFAIVLTVAAGASAQLKDPKIGSRPLTDIDMEKYVAILTEVTKAQRQIKDLSSPAGLQQLREATAKACEPHGWGTLDYGVVNARLTTAQQHIKMEKSVPVPADKAADVALARKFAEKIAAAKKR